MKYLISLVAGIVLGAAAFFMLLYYNPFMAQNKLSPLSVTDNELISLEYSTVAANSLIYTNDGESQIAPYPAKVLQLWERSVSQTSALATVLKNSRNHTVGIGIKFSSDSESTRILNGEVIVDSVWHIYLPARGSLFIEQQVNYWGYLRDIVIPAYRSSGDNWRGIWNGNTTSGPGALGTATVVGGSGKFEGLQTEGVEALTAKAYSVDRGPVAIDGNITIEMPQPEAEATPGP